MRVRILAAERLDDAAAKTQRAIRVFINGDQALDSVARRLGQRGDGEVTLVLQLEEGLREVEVKLPGRFQVTPQIASAIKAIPGVLAVQQA